ncbi:MAG TPA: YihY/virulence factor BrkB family protein [Bacteriovoracaceae bacterium]|nr:YihY/virulence factor BrkB family protein [Bacteriovoracaceae bacterium]
MKRSDLEPRTTLFPMWKLNGLTWRELLTRTLKQFGQHRILDQSAKLAFYFLLSIFPLLLFLITLLGFMLQSGPDLKLAIHRYLATVVPPSASGLIQTTLAEITAETDTLKLSLALVFTWWPASQAMLAIIDSLNNSYGVRDDRPWWKKYLIASELTVITLLLISGSILVLIYGGELSDLVMESFGFEGFVAGAWLVLHKALLLLVVMLIFNIIYVYAPAVEKRSCDWPMPGTVVGVALWLAASYGFQIYLYFFNQFTTIYGSIGVVIILLIWFYISSVAILTGAAVNAEIEKRR